MRETLLVLKENEKTPDDVLFVSDGNGGQSTWRYFAEKADFDYDDGYGSRIINRSLVIVGDGWWLDGSEWWNFKRPPERAEHTGTLKMRDREDE